MILKNHNFNSKSKKFERKGVCLHQYYDYNLTVLIKIEKEILVLLIQ